MSLESIQAMREQRKSQVEDNPSAETFQIVGGETFKGTFDNSREEENKDKGNITQKKRNPAVMVDSMPSGLIERTSKIQREDGTEYTFWRVGKDDEGIPILWLL